MLLWDTISRCLWVPVRYSPLAPSSTLPTHAPPCANTLAAPCPQKVTRRSYTCLVIPIVYSNPTPAQRLPSPINRCTSGCIHHQLPSSYHVITASIRVFVISDSYYAIFTSGGKLGQKPKTERCRVGFASCFVKEIFHWREIHSCDMVNLSKRLLTRLFNTFTSLDVGGRELSFWTFSHQGKLAIAGRGCVQSWGMNCDSIPPIVHYLPGMIT